jgi:hypothetical protein
MFALLKAVITGYDRAFECNQDETGSSTNFALLRLHAKLNYFTFRIGSNDSFNPQVDASSPGVGDKGGKTDLRSFSGEIMWV